MDALASGADATLEVLTVSTAPLRPGASIGNALKQLDTGTAAVPVQDTERGIMGWVRHRVTLTALTTTTS
jgi:hypothetical protein